MKGLPSGVLGRGVRMISLFSLGVALTACRTKMDVVMLGPPGPERAPVPFDSVYLFSGPDRVLLKYEPIARLSVGLSFTTNSLEDDLRVEESLRKKAGELGADAIIITEMAEGSSERFWDGFPSGTATAISFSGSGFSKEVGAAHAPGDLGPMVIAPLAVPEDLPVHDSILDAFAQDLHVQLREAGFDLLPVGTWEAVWEELMTSEAKGLKDPLTDFKRAGETRSLERSVQNALIEEYGADGFLFPDIVGVEAYFVGNEAHWDGVSQKVGNTRSTGAKALSVLANILVRGGYDSEEDSPPDPDGWVWALSLVVQMENAIGASLFTGRGGIELLEHADFEGGIYVGDPGPEDYEVMEIPHESLFQRRGRVSRSVRIALSTLVGGD